MSRECSNSQVNKNIFWLGIRNVLTVSKKFQSAEYKNYILFLQLALNIFLLSFLERFYVSNPSSNPPSFLFPISFYCLYILIESLALLIANITKIFRKLIQVAVQKMLIFFLSSVMTIHLSLLRP